MDPEPMYPVDATTQDAMVESAPEAEGMNLDDAIAEAVREKRAGGGNRGGRGNLRGDRGGAGPHPERRLKVRAVIVKRGVGPTGGGGGRHGQGGRGYGGGGPPQRKLERVFKRDDGVVVVHIYGNDVLAVDPSGAVRLNSEGDRGRNTFRAMNESLNKFGFKLTKSEANPEEWSVGDGKRFLKRYEDGMVIPAPKPPGPGRGLALMQRDEPRRQAPFGGRGAPFGGRGRGRGRY